GTLQITGTGKANVISVDLKGSKVVATLDRLTQTFAKSLVKRFHINGVGGDDAIAVNVARSSTLIGGSGNDTFVSTTASDSIEGDAGDDRMIASGGSDIFIAGGGM